MRIVNPDQEEYSGLVQVYKDDGKKKFFLEIIHAKPIVCYCFYLL